MLNVVAIKRGYQHRGLMCRVLSLSYDFQNQIGVLFMPEYNCCDMTGAIEVFQQIHPDVQVVMTIAGNEADTAYHRQPNGEWVAELPRWTKTEPQGYA